MHMIDQPAAVKLHGWILIQVNHSTARNSTSSGKSGNQMG